MSHYNARSTRRTITGLSVFILTALAAIAWLPAIEGGAQEQQQQVQQGRRGQRGQGRRGRGQRGQGRRGRRGRAQQAPTPPIPVPPRERTAVNDLVDRLSFDNFKENVRHLAAYGTRRWNTPQNAEARDWIEAQLQSWGYETGRVTFTPGGGRAGEDPIETDSVYATKIGTRYPDRMYIISAHMDSFNTQSEDQSFAPGANDDGSGTSLVLEAARVFASAGVETEVSIRFCFWNCEEIGLLGARAYVEQRNGLQGIEDPPGSGKYPEPRWLGVIQHDMMMFDHGMPDPETGELSAEQIARADVDIEYDSTRTFGGRAQELASKLLAANAKYATDYPAEVGQFMQSTDSVPFAGYVPSISLRENERRNEIGRGADPQWHKNSDVFETYSDKDFRLGFNALQMTTGAVAEMTGMRIEN